MNDYKPYKQLKQKQKAKVVERMYKELHQFFSDNQRFPDTRNSTAPARRITMGTACRSAM